MSVLLAWGSSDYDQYPADSNRSEQRSPTLIDHFLLKNLPVLSIACGGRHTLLLTLHGQVFSFGHYSEGAIGREGNPCRPEQVQLPQPVDLISTGENHSVCATADGTVYTWGTFGRGGDSLPMQRYMYPHKLGQYENQTPRKLCSGNNHFLILTRKSLYMCWGSDSRITSQPRANNTSLMIERVPLANVDDAFAGGDHCFALICTKAAPVYGKDSPRKLTPGRDRAALLAWGLNDFSQLGFSSSNDNQWECRPSSVPGIDPCQVNQIACGDKHSLVLLKDGTVWGCGLNEESQCGPAFTSSTSSIYSRFTRIDLGGPVSALATSGHSNFALMKNQDDSLISWGLGSAFLLANSSENVETNPFHIHRSFHYDKKGFVSVGGSHAIFLENYHPLDKKTPSSIAAKQNATFFTAPPSERSLVATRTSSHLSEQGLNHFGSNTKDKFFASKQDKLAKVFRSDEKAAKTLGQRLGIDSNSLKKQAPTDDDDDRDRSLYSGRSRLTSTNDSLITC